MGVYLAIVDNRGTIPTDTVRRRNEHGANVITAAEKSWKPIDKLQEDVKVLKDF